MKTLEKSTKYVNVSTIAIFIIGALSLASSILILSYSHAGLLPGDSGHYIGRIAAKIISENKLILYDELSFSGRTLSLQQGSPAILAIFSKLTGLALDKSGLILPGLLGIISMIAFYLIVLKLLYNRKLAQISTLFLVLSPPFIYTFSVLNLRMLPIALTLMAVSLLLYDRKKLAFMFFILIPFFGTIDAIISLSLLLINVLARKRNKRMFFSLLLLDALLIILLNIPVISAYGLPSPVNFKINETGINFAFQNFIAELGGKFGISIFLMLLAIAGLAALWKRRYQYLNVYLSLLLFILLAIYLVWPVIHLNFIVSMLAAIGLFNILSIRWESKMIRNFTIFLMCSGLAFAFFSYLSYLSDMNPKQGIIDSLQVLNAESNPGDIVLSHYSNGFWIEGIASRISFMDANFVYAPDVNSRYYDSEKIFHSKSIDEVTNLLDNHNIKYIWITKEMKSGQVWQTEDEDLLFLLRYDIKFKKLFSNQDAEIWWYKGA